MDHILCITVFTNFFFVFFIFQEQYLKNSKQKKLFLTHAVIDEYANFNFSKEALHLLQS